MNRNLTTDAVVLKAERFGEMNKTVTLFSPELGVLRAAVYGAYKGKNKLSGSTEPFVRGTVYLYFEPVKKRYKVTALEPTHTHESIPQDLDRYFTASLWAEMLIKGYGGGDDAGSLFDLLCSSLSALAHCDSEVVNLQFLWRYLITEGYAIDLNHCGHCERSLPEGDVTFLNSDGELTCDRCSFEGAPSVPAGVRRYLRHTRSLPFKEAVKVGIGSALARITKTFLLRNVQAIMEYPLRTLDFGMAPG